MRQEDDEIFINLLNQVRVGNVDENVEHLLRSRFINKHDPSNPTGALHIFTKFTMSSCLVNSQLH